MPGQLQATEASIQNLINKLNRMPLPEIGENLRRTLANLDVTLTTARGTLMSAHSTIDNANALVEPNSAQAQELDATLQEVSRAARSVRVLADYLDRHPEALLRGKRAGEK